jgi:hypothetical protein
MVHWRASATMNAAVRKSIPAQLFKASTALQVAAAAGNRDVENGRIVPAIHRHRGAATIGWRHTEYSPRASCLSGLFQRSKTFRGRERLG